jgi:hypothetical protein
MLLDTKTQYLQDESYNGCLLCSKRSQLNVESTREGFLKLLGWPATICGLTHSIYHQ